VSEVKTEIKAKDGVITVLRSQEVDAILKLNRRAFNDVPTWRPNSRATRRRVAEIPFAVAEQWMQEGINVFSADPDMQRAVQRKLNDPEYKDLRTCPGKVRIGRAGMNYARSP
jgi:hypothetical protein